MPKKIITALILVCMLSFLTPQPSFAAQWTTCQIDQIGITNLGTGAVILKTDGGKEFPISAFSAETAKIISMFQEAKQVEIPSMYHMVEQICEELGMLLVKVRIYNDGNALRANLYFTGKKELILRNYRASDAIALATVYGVPILVRKSLLNKNKNASF